MKVPHKCAGWITVVWTCVLVASWEMDAVLPSSQQTSPQPPKVPAFPGRQVGAYSKIQGSRPESCSPTVCREAPGPPDLQSAGN